MTAHAQLPKLYLFLNLLAFLEEKLLFHFLYPIYLKVLRGTIKKRKKYILFLLICITL